MSNKILSKSEVNHLRRLLGYMRCEIGQSPEEYKQTVKKLMAHDGVCIDGDGQSNLVEGYQKSANIPSYVRDAINVLEKMLKRYEGDVVDGDYADEENNTVKQINADPIKRLSVNTD